MTILNLGTKTEVLNFLPNDVVTATVTASTAIDLVDYEGDIAVITSPGSVNDFFFRFLAPAWYEVKN